MKIEFAPLHPWLRPSPTWTKTDERALLRARRNGWITDTVADRLMLRYANMQLELVHPDVQP